MNVLLKIKYSIKIKNKSLIFSIILYYITCVFLILFADLWEFVELTSVIIPIALCTNVLSQEYDNKMEGIVILSGTPIYRIVFLRYFISFFISQLTILALFFIAWITNHLKGDLFLKHYIIIFLYSIFLTLLGLLISNITKNTITGYGVSMGYFIFQIVGGNFILGKYCPILATSFNLTLKEHIIINNLYFMIIISIILFLINLLYISNEKKIKRCVLKITGLALIIFSIIILRNKYIDYKKSALVSKIISNNKETVYIIDKQNERLFSYCKSKNISFLTEDNVSLEKYKDKNIIVISKYDSRLINNIKDKLKLNMGLDKRDLILEDHGIYNVSSYRILLNNPLNKENKILLIETRSLNRKDLDVLLNGKQGSFVAVKNGMILATKIYDTKHINIDNFFEDVSTCQSNSWKIKKNNKAQMLYRNIEKKDSEKLFCLWYKIKKIIDKNIKCDNCKEHFQVYLRDDNIKLEENFIPFKIELLLDLEQEREYKVRDMFSKKYLDEKGFKFIRDNRLKDGWMEFINQVIIYPSIYNDNSFGNEYIRIMKQKTKEERELTTEDDYIYLSGKILFLIENNNKRMEFIREIINRDSYIDNNEIEKIYSKYVGIKIAKDQMKYFNKR